MALIRNDPQRRTLAGLGVAAAIFLLLAIAALWQRSAELAPKYQATPMFEGLDANAVAAIRVRSRAGAFTVERRGPHDWRLPQKSGFPADENQVLATVRGVASLEAVDPKTANPEWHAQLGLVAPEKNGEATEVTLLDAAGKPLAELLIGKAADVADAMGRGAIYVRKAGDNQSWVARGYLMARPNLSDWLSKNVVTLGRERIQGAEVTPASGPAYVASRARKELPDFTVPNLPAGRTLAFESAADVPAGALVGFAFEDVAPIATVDFAAPQVTHVTRTFDGLVVTVRIVEKDHAHWAAISAAAAQPAAQAEATAINGRAGGWAFKLADFKYTMFAATLESLLKPLGSPPGAPQPPARAPIP